MEYRTHQARPSMRPIALARGHHHREKPSRRVAGSKPPLLKSPETETLGGAARNSMFSIGCSSIPFRDRAGLSVIAVKESDAGDPHRRRAFRLVPAPADVGEV